MTAAVRVEVADEGDDVLVRLAAARDKLLLEDGVIDPGLARMAALS